jgi:WD40 repeat protein/energy-coupling factor transporter ATP-binding protein EcfA2
MDALVRTNPFPGLRPFMPEEADLFFGRDKQSDELVRRLAGRRFLAVVGNSGSGKSSLVRAGLLPSLEGGLMAEAGAHWRIAILRPQDDPIRFLARAIVETGVLANLDLAPPAAEGVVETTLRRSGLGLVEAARLARLEPHENLLIVVDQFEELFRFADVAMQRGAGDEAPAFVKLLLEAARQTEVQVYVVITMRSDFLGDCARFRNLPEAISDCQYLIPRLTRDELQAVITGPVGVRGGRIAPSLVQRLLNDIGDDMDQLPVLQHALMRAWDHWERNAPEARPIELSDLEAIGGMAEALSQHADEAFASLASGQDREIAERLFKCLTERGPDNRETRRPTPLSRIATIVNTDSAALVRVIEVFRAPGRSFLMPPQGVQLSGDSVIDISHESLIRQWGQLRTWVEEEAESRATYLRLVEAARLHRAGRAGLWGEPDLTYARQWQERNAPNATWAERYASGFDEAIAFLRDSEAAHAAELERERQRAEAECIAKERELEQAKALAEAQRQRADEQAAARTRQRRTNRVLRGLLGLAVLTGSYGWWKQEEAKEKGRFALSRQVIMHARDEQRVRGSEKALSLKRAVLLAASAYRIAPDGATRAELQRALLAQLPPYHILSLQQGGRFDFSPDGKMLAMAGEGKTMSLGHVPTEPLARERGLVSVAFSPDGKKLASAREDNTVILWDVATRKPLGEALRLQHERDFAPSVAFGPNGETPLSANDKTVMRWEVATGKPVVEPYGDAVSSVAFSPDGTMRTSASYRTMTLGNASTGTPLGESRGDSVSSVAFSPDGKVLASASDSTVVLWDAATGKVLGETVGGHEGAVMSVAFSRDGRTLASGGSDRNVILWDVADPVHPEQRGSPLKAHRKEVSSVAFGCDGKMLASASFDETVILWDIERGKPRRKLQGHRDRVWDLAFSPDCKQLASAGLDKKVILWDVASGQPLGKPLEGHRDPVRSVAFSPDGEMLASGSSDDTVILWDVASRQPMRAPLKIHGGDVWDVAFSKEGKLVSASLDQTVLWDVRNLNILGGALEDLDVEVRSVAYSPYDKLLAFAGEDGTVILWDTANQKRSGPPLEGLQGQIRGLAFSPNGKLLASAGEDGTVMLWDVSSRKSVGEPLKIRRGGAVTSVAFSPDGKMLASAGEDGTVILWGVASHQPLVEQPEGQGAPITSIAFSPDGKMLASAGGNGAVILWDTASHKRLGSPLEGHEGQIYGLAFSPDGKMLASAGEDGTVMLWDVSSRKSVGEPLKIRRGGAVTSVAFSPDGKMLASAGRDKSVNLWHVGRGKLVGEPLGDHQGPVAHVAFSPDSKTLASAGLDKTVILWDVDVASWLRHACQIFGRNWEKKEWVKYMGDDVPYEAPCPDLPIPMD